MSNRTNYFNLLDLDPSEKNEAKIRSAIKDKQNLWSGWTNHPNKRMEALANLEKLPDINRVMLDPRLRNEEAEDAKREILTLEKQKHEEIRSLASRIIKNGKISAQELDVLTRRFSPYTEAEILKIIGAEKEKFIIYFDDGIQPLDLSVASRIRENLDTVKKANLFDFLGLPSTSPCAVLLKKADEIYLKNSKSPITVIVTANLSLTGDCKAYFKTEDAKKRYEKTLDLEVFEKKIKPLLELDASKGCITTHEYNDIFHECIKNGISMGRSSYFLQEYLKKNKIPLAATELPPRTDKKTELINRICMFRGGALSLTQEQAEFFIKELMPFHHGSQAAAEREFYSICSKNGISVTEGPAPSEIFLTHLMMVINYFSVLYSRFQAFGRRLPMKKIICAFTIAAITTYAVMFFTNDWSEYTFLKTAEPRAEAKTENISNQADSVVIENVRFVGDNEYADRSLTSVNIANGLISIGINAFRGNRLTSINIPNSVTYIGRNAFAGNPITSITIGANVVLGADGSRIGVLGQGTGFNNAYDKNGKKAGTYTRANVNSTVWTFRPPASNANPPNRNAAQGNRDANPSNRNAAIEHFNRGGTLFSRGDFAGAVREYSAAINLYPNFVEAYINRGVSHNRQGNNNQAINDYSAAIRISPSDAMAYSNRGITHVSLGNANRAIEDFSNAIRLEPTAFDYNNRGVEYFKMGNYDLAIADFEAALRLEPNDERARINLEIARQQKRDVV